MLTDLIALMGPDLPGSRLLLALAAYILLLLLLGLGLMLLTIQLHRNNERKARTWKQLEQSWDPLMIKALAGEMSPAEVLAEIAPEQGLFFVDFLTKYTLRLSGASRQTLEALAAPWLPKLASRVADGDDEQRARAVFTLSTLAPDPYRIVIAGALEDPVPLVAMLAARSLAENHASEYLELLLRHLDRFKAWSPGYLTSMLVEIAKPEPELLRKALSEDYPVWIRTVTLRALAELNDLQSLPLAAELLRSDADPELQAAALDLLGRLGYGEHKQLVRHKCRSPHFVIRLHAVKALIRLGDGEDQLLFTQLLEDDSQWIAFQAAQGLKAIEAVDTLEQLAESEHPRAELAEQVLYDFDSDKLLLASAQNPGFVRRVPAWIRASARRQSLLAWQRVQRVLFHPETHPEVRLAIAGALGPEASPFLQQALVRELGVAPAPYLYRAIYQLNPVAALETLGQHFALSQDEASRIEIANLILQQHTPASQAFAQRLQQQLSSNALAPGLQTALSARLAQFGALPAATARTPETA